MNDQDKTKEELITELQELRQAHASLKATIETDLLSYKPAEEIYPSSEERYQLLFNKFPLGYQSLDFIGNFMEVNQHWLSMLGYERNEVIGKWFGDFLSSDYQEGFRKQFPIFKAQGHIHFEFEMVHKNGSVLYIAFEGGIGYNIKGDFELAHCIIQDITERRQTEQALRESKNRLNEEQKLAHIGVWDWEAKTDRVIWSEELYQLSGIDPGLPAPSFAEHPKIYTPESWIILKTAVENTMKTGELYQLELDLIRTDGTIRNVKAFGGAKYDTLGQFAGLFGTLQDITEGKLSESIFKDIIEKNPMSVQILNMEGYVIQTNSAHTKLFGVFPPC